MTTRKMCLGARQEQTMRYDEILDSGVASISFRSKYPRGKKGSTPAGVVTIPPTTSAARSEAHRCRTLPQELRRSHLAIHHGTATEVQYV